MIAFTCFRCSLRSCGLFPFFLFNDTATTEIYTLSLHDALPIYSATYSHLYTEDEKSLFERRLEMRIDAENPIALQGLLMMYANPVVNKLKYHNELKS